MWLFSTEMEWGGSSSRWRRYLVGAVQLGSLVLIEVPGWAGWRPVLGQSGSRPMSTGRGFTVSKRIFGSWRHFSLCCQKASFGSVGCPTPLPIPSTYFGCTLINDPFVLWTIACLWSKLNNVSACAQKHTFLSITAALHMWLYAVDTIFDFFFYLLTWYLNEVLTW